MGIQMNMEKVQRTKKKRWKFCNMIHTGTWSLHNHRKYSTLIYNFCHVCQSQYRVSIDSPSVVVGLDLHLSRIHNEVVCAQLNPWKKYLLQALHITADCIVTKGPLIYWLNKAATIKIKALTWALLFPYHFHWSDLDTCPPSTQNIWLSIKWD